MVYPWAMASTSRRSLRERVLAVFGGRRPARHTCSSCNDLQQEQKMNETGSPVPVASPNSNIQSSTLPSTSRVMRRTGLGTEAVQFTDRVSPQKSISLGSFQHCTLSSSVWPFARFQETLLAHSELDRSFQMQKPTTESKNSSVRYKTKKMNGNTSVPNMSTEDNFSLLATLCSEENRSSQMFDSSAGILDANSQSTTPLTSGPSCEGPPENDGGLAFGVSHESPARKTSCDRRSIGVETDAVCDKEENTNTERRDLPLSHGAKTIIKTADAVIKIFDGSLSITGRFKEVVVQLNDKNVSRSSVVGVAASTDTAHTENYSSLPQHAVNCIHKDIYVDVGVATSLTESCTTSYAHAPSKEDTTESVQPESRGQKYRLMNSDDDDESSLEHHNGGLTAAKHCINASRPTVENNVSGIQSSVVTVSGTSSSSDVRATSGVRGNATSLRSKAIDCVDKHKLDTGCHKDVAPMPNTTRIHNEHFQQELQNSGRSENPFVDVGGRSSDVPPENASIPKPCLLCSGTDSPQSVSSCSRVVDIVDPNSHSKRHFLGTVYGPKNENDCKDNAERICLGFSKYHNCESCGIATTEDAPELVKEHMAYPVITGEGSQQNQESVSLGDTGKSECECHSDVLGLDDCEMSAAADSSTTIVDGCSPGSHHPECGTASKHNNSDGADVDAKMVLHRDGSSSGSLVDECGLVDVYKLTQQINHQTGKLNKLMDKYRSRALKIERLQRYLVQLNKEKEEMCRLLQCVSRETAALRLEAAELRCTVSAVCDASVAAIGKETDARRLEPTCYRRYTNIRTAADASSALAAVRCRIKALNELEVLVYRKQLMLNHILPGLHQDALLPTKPALLASKTLKSKKSEQTSHERGSRNNVVIEVLSEPNSWSEIQTYTDSALTLSTALTTSNDGTASVGQLLGTDV